MFDSKKCTIHVRNFSLFSCPLMYIDANRRGTKKENKRLQTFVNESKYFPTKYNS